jgi:RNA polymerase sigma-70 factor, ECF subfamily
MEDKELINLLKNGHEESFRLIVDKSQKFVLNSCYRFVNNAETAEDLTQEVFLEVFRSIKHFRGDSKLSTWIYRIAVTKSLDYLKRQKRQKRFAAIRSIFREEEQEEQIASPSDTNPDRELEQKERAEILAWAMDSLPENQRIAFTLSKYNELSYNEIAEILETSVSSVESLIHRAKANLKKKLYNYYKKQN